MSYEFTKFYPAVCKGLGVEPSEAPEALYWAIQREFDRLSVNGVLTGSFVSSVHDAVDAISADEQFVTRIDRVEDVRDGDLVTITVPVVEYVDWGPRGLWVDLDEVCIIRDGKLSEDVTFHYAIRKGFQ